MLVKAIGADSVSSGSSACAPAAVPAVQPVNADVTSAFTSFFAPLFVGSATTGSTESTASGPAASAESDAHLIYANPRGDKKAQKSIDHHSLSTRGSQGHRSSGAGKHRPPQSQYQHVSSDRG